MVRPLLLNPSESPLFLPCMNLLILNRGNFTLTKFVVRSGCDLQIADHIVLVLFGRKQSGYSRKFIILLENVLHQH